MDCGIDEGDAIRNDFINYDYDAQIDFDDNNVYTLPTIYGYNVTFDLNFILDGQGDDGFYGLPLSTYRYVFSLNNNTNLQNAYQILNLTQCSRTVQDGTLYTDISAFEYSFDGYIYRQGWSAANPAGLITISYHKMLV